MAILVEPVTLQIAQLVPCTEAEGPGKRFALWFQGCPLRCPGCCNPEFLPFTGGESKTLAEMTEWLLRTKEESGIEGITLLGGEPFAHAASAAAFARSARELGLSVMVFTGYTLEELELAGRASDGRDVPSLTRPANKNGSAAIAELLALTDILVDGPYLREQPDTNRRWIGSTNQRIHFLTERYRFDEQWRQRNTLEIRVLGNEVQVNGFPAANAVGLWKGWTRKTPTRTSTK